MNHSELLRQVHGPQVVALVCSILAFILSFVALLTPAWQSVYAREIQQWVQSGLWMNCQTRPSGMYTCAYSFTERDYDFYMSADLNYFRTPPFYSWQRHLLAVYLIGQMIAFMSFSAFCCSFHPFTSNLSSICSVGFLGVAFLIHTGCTATFLIFSQMVEYRFFHVSVSGIYEKHIGYSWYVELVAVLFYAIALVCAVVHLIRSRMGAGKPLGNSRLDQPQYFGRLDPYETQLAMRRLPETPKEYQYGY